MKKLSESVWGDIRRRGNGSVEKQEDAFNPEYIDFGDNTTVYWAVENLQIENKVKFTFDEVKDYNNNGWRLPTYKEVEQIDWTGTRIKHNIGYKSINFNDGNRLKIVTNGEGGSRFWTKDSNEKYPTGATGYDAEGNEYNFNKSNTLFVFLVKDKNYVNESVWNDIRKRGNGTDVKKEDELTNIRDIQPVDMGVSVLWADRDLERKDKDDDCFFEFDEANEIIKNTDWRIPTKDETYELFRYAKELKNTDDVCIIRGDFDDGPELEFYKKGFKYANSDKLTWNNAHFSWTTTHTDNSETYFMSTIKEFQYFSPMHNRNKICVRLVKDKK